MRQYEILELQFTGEEPSSSKVDVDVSVEVICNGKKKIVNGFYAGNGVYKVPFTARRRKI
ncbi:ABC-type transporter MlaC component [Streptococcus rupicaprae]|uniref:ABC-type transporter MlaC component n=1 Tax=Streptococcus rupicaprae TaxID=759619 RepID=A0ABV2FIF7_9STRE